MAIISFSQILGQERAKEFLKQALSREKLPHAYLFTGIPGIGKTSMAIALTMALNCREPVNYDACGHCPPCRQMMGGNFPDFLSVRPDGQNIKINQIRGLNRKLCFAPISGKYRVSIIYRAETMTNEAANSFLKTLEEPPPGNILILNATEPLDLLATIVSRCQKVPFNPLPVQGMADWLVENRKLDEEKAIVLARISGGSLGLAQKMCDGDFFDKRQEWLSRLTMLPGFSKQKALEMAVEYSKEFSKTDPEKPKNGKPIMMDMLAIWESWYRDLLVLTTGGSTNLIINVDLSHKLKKIIGRYSIDYLINSLMSIDQAQQDLLRMRNSRLVIEHTVLKLNSLKDREVMGLQ